MRIDCYVEFTRTSVREPNSAVEMQVFKRGSLLVSLLGDTWDFDPSTEGGLSL